MYYLDEFHTGYIVVDKGTFFCKCCVFACQHRSTNDLRYTIIEMKPVEAQGTFRQRNALSYSNISCWLPCLRRCSSVSWSLMQTDLSAADYGVYNCHQPSK